MRVLSAFLALAALGAVVPAHGSVLDASLACLRRCGSQDFGECIERDLSRSIGRAMSGNRTYRLNRYLTVTLVEATPADGDRRTEDGGLADVLLSLFNSLRVQYEPEEPDEAFEGKYICAQLS